MDLGFKILSDEEYKALSKREKTAYDRKKSLYMMQNNAAAANEDSRFEDYTDDAIAETTKTATVIDDAKKEATKSATVENKKKDSETTKKEPVKEVKEEEAEIEKESAKESIKEIKESQTAQKTKSKKSAKKESTQTQSASEKVKCVYKVSTENYKFIAIKAAKNGMSKIDVISQIIAKEMEREEKNPSEIDYEQISFKRRTLESSEQLCIMLPADQKEFLKEQGARRIMKEAAYFDQILTAARTKDKDSAKLMK